MQKEKNLPILNRTILDVRKVLQDQLERLNDPKADLEKEHKRSQAIHLVSSQLIASAKIEADLLAKNRNFKGTGFFDAEAKPLEIGNGK
jgi:hypothetical protein